MDMPPLMLGNFLSPYLVDLSEGEHARITWFNSNFINERKNHLYGWYSVTLLRDASWESTFCPFSFIPRLPASRLIPAQEELWAWEKTNRLMPRERCCLRNQLHPISFLLTPAFVSENELSFFPLSSFFPSAELGVNPSYKSFMPLINRGPRKCQILMGLNFGFKEIVQRRQDSSDSGTRRESYVWPTLSSFFFFLCLCACFLPCKIKRVYHTGSSYMPSGARAGLQALGFTPRPLEVLILQIFCCSGLLCL